MWRAILPQMRRLRVQRGDKLTKQQSKSASNPITEIQKMYTRYSSGITLYQFDNLRQYDEVVAAASGRHGGISAPPYTSLNLHFQVGDKAEAVRHNRQLLAQALEIDLKSVICGQQTHGLNVAVVNQHDRGKGALAWDDALPETDAIVTNVPGIFPLMTFADCVPIVLFDPIHKAIGLVHAGWKGTVGGIVTLAIAALTREFGSEPSQIIAGIGPSIGPCCYEVGAEVIAAARARPEITPALVTTADEHIHFDLWQANRLRMLHSGLKEENIEVARLCTACNRHLLFSHRGDRGQSGRLAFVAGMRKADD
jgi:YfiH family protein